MAVRHVPPPPRWLVIASWLLSLLFVGWLLVSVR